MWKARDTSNINWHQYFRYDESSPTCLIWNTTLINKNGHINSRAQEGRIAGTRTGGRVEVRVGEVSYKASRVIWEMHYESLGEDDLIDHIDKDFTNSRLSNLRKVGHKTNMQNTNRHKRNTSGVCGVYKDAITRPNKKYEYWVAGWCDSAGKLQRKRWAVDKYGAEEAFRLACEYRRKMIEELNQQGAGYTERHGKDV